MLNVKRGFIVQISKQDGIGIIQEVNTQTEWIFYLDEIPRHQRGDLHQHTEVEFFKDDSCEQFIAVDVAPLRNQLERTA